MKNLIEVAKSLSRVPLVRSFNSAIPEIRNTKKNRIYPIKVGATLLKNVESALP